MIHMTHCTLSEHIVAEEFMPVEGFGRDLIMRQISRIIASKLDAIKRGDFEEVAGILDTISEKISSATGIKVSTEMLISLIQTGLTISGGDWKKAMGGAGRFLSELSSRIENEIAQVALKSLGEFLSGLSNAMTAKDHSSPLLMAAVPGDVDSEFTAATANFETCCCAPLSLSAAAPGEELDENGQPKTGFIMEAIAIITFGVKAYAWIKKRREEKKKQQQG